MNKPIMQDIADSLSVSRISVWKALNNRPGVSDELRERILKEAVDIGYLKEPVNGADIEKVQTRTIAAVVSRPESSIFWMQIIHQIAKELSLQRVNLMYIYMPTHSNTDIEAELPDALSDGSVSGIIVLNVYSEAQLRMLAELPIPKVFLDSVPALSLDRMDGDIVLIEGRSAVRQITKRLLDSGYTKLGFVGDIHYAQTNMDRYQGFMDAFAELGIKTDATFSMTGKLHLDTHYQQIEAFLKSLKTMPDGFVCASDYIAHFIQRYFDENGIDQSKIYLTGFDNNSEYTNVMNKITTVDVQTGSMGERLANKIMFAINHPNLPNEVSYVLTNVIYRSFPNPKKGNSKG